MRKSFFSVTICLKSSSSILPLPIIKMVPTILRTIPLKKRLLVMVKRSTSPFAGLYGTVNGFEGPGSSKGFKIK